MFSKNVIAVGVLLFVVGLGLGYGISISSNTNENEIKYQALHEEIQKFKTYLTCVPYTHEEVKPTSDTWVHYNYDENGTLMLIEVETTKKQNSPSWAYLPEGHPGMNFEHWVLHIWFQDPEKSCPDMDDLIRRLSAEGLEVQLGEEISQPFFTVKGNLLHVNNETLRIFTYENSESATMEAGKISNDGESIEGHALDWPAKPHFYASGRIIVLYLGEDIELMHFLEQILEPQFAGA